MAPGRLRGGAGQFVGQRKGVGAQRVDGPAGLGQAAGGHALRGGQCLEGAVRVVVHGEQRPDGLQLDAERAQGVREHVVYLTRDPRPFLQDIGPPLLGAQLLVLGQQLPGLLGLDPERGPVPPEEHADREQQREPQQGADTLVEDDSAGLRGQDAEQRAGESGLRGQFLGSGQQGDGGERDQEFPAAPGRPAQAPGGGHRAEGDRQHGAPRRGRPGAPELGRAPRRYPGAGHRVGDDLCRGPAVDRRRGAEGEHADDRQPGHPDTPERGAQHLPIMATRAERGRHRRPRCRGRGRRPAS